MKKPQMWTMEDWKKCGNTSTFNEHHGTNVGPWIRGSEKTGGKKSLSGLFGMDTFLSHREDHYEKYVEWFNVYYTKLGQALE